MAKKRVYEAAKEMGISTKEMFKMLAEVGIEKSSPFNTIEEEEYEVVRELFTVEAEEEGREEPKGQLEVEVEPLAPPRPPVVTVLGHVDHGKTTLLDYIRKTKVAQSEAGGITQSIGAYQIEFNGKPITFIDTPGHRAFTQMRARGAQVTDIAILMVAADDGVMAQTKEAISHAQAAGVPIIVAINKIDKSDADLEQVKEQLAKEGLVPEEWGGETITVPISALRGDNIDDLLEMILLVAELEDLRADPGKKAEGIIIEGNLDSNRGAVATAVIRDGTLRERDAVLAGAAYGRIRTLLDENDRRVKEAPPGSAVQILGFSEVPPAGAHFEAVDDLSKAKELAEQRKEEEHRRRLERSRRSAMDLFRQRIRKGGEIKPILKADTVGSLEALEGELSRLKVEGISLELLHTGVGNISESDVLLASSVEEGALIIGFRTGVEAKAKEMAEQEGVAIRSYDVIYELAEDVKGMMESAVEPKYEEIRVGEAEVRNIFNIPGVGMVAGCYVKEGLVTRDAKVRVIRNGSEVFKGSVRSLRRFDRDVRKVEKAKECGIRIEGYNDIKIGDILELLIVREIETR